MAITRDLRARVDFFREHAPVVVGETLKGALDLANAERRRFVENLVAVWDYQPGDGWVCRMCLPVNGMDYSPEPGEVLASMGGIEEGDDNPQGTDYGRVIEAELALEAIRELDRR